MALVVYARKRASDIQRIFLIQTQFVDGRAHRNVECRIDDTDSRQAGEIAARHTVDTRKLSPDIDITARGNIDRVDLPGNANIERGITGTGIRVEPLQRSGIRYINFIMPADRNQLWPRSSFRPPPLIDVAIDEYMGQARPR
jgi:hypothetical protein